ncbi:putative transcription accessory protein [Escherichia coli]|uniref:Putative transcription accessory protein n=1 Tax=Escherichia coli TaxID=562 RepID=A0A376MLG0_ECOLX|nr:putative transcription accessory protein [Escherichia coli]
MFDADKGVADTKAALDGARYILMERFAEDAALLAKVRDYLWKNAHLVSTVVSGKEEEGAKFRDYFDHHEPYQRCLLTARWRCSVGVTKAYFSFR